MMSTQGIHRLKIIEKEQLQGCKSKVYQKLQLKISCKELAQSVQNNGYQKILIPFCHVLINFTKNASGTGCRRKIPVLAAILLFFDYVTTYIIKSLLKLYNISQFLMNCIELNNQQQPQLNNLSTLLYENSLLKQRNRTLQSQNQILLSRIEQLEQILIAKNQSIKNYDKKTNIYESNFMKQKEQITKIIAVLEKKMNERQSSRIKVLNEMMKNGCAPSILLETIFEIVQDLDIKQNVKNANSDMNRLQKLVQRRKQKLASKENKSRDIVHLVKQPTWEQSYLIQADLEYVIRAAEKITRNAKRKEIDQQKIGQIFKQLLSYVNLRKSIRQQQKTLKIRQRQIELGVGCRMAFQQLSSRLLSLSEKQLAKKQEIEEMTVHI